MILPFSTQINGKPTYFVEKIHKSFRIKEVNLQAGIDPSIHYTKDYNFVAKDKLPAKIHTIREDKKDRWKPGTMIDFFINTRTKDMFRFAPRIPVVGVQVIKIKYYYQSDDYNKKVDVYVDHCFLGQYYFNKVNPNGEEELIELAQNDGFKTVEDFFEYFNEDFTGKIIHWTDKKY